MGGCLDIFSLIYHSSFLSPSLWETARYRLKYCLKGSLRPKQKNKQKARVATFLKIVAKPFKMNGYSKTIKRSNFAIFSLASFSVGVNSLKKETFLKSGIV